jgi:uncharacterized membrane-anchored protein YhcB (DUF1043 family)
METMSGWDVALLAVVGYVAVTALVRLMIRRRDQLRDEFRRRMNKEKQRKEVDEQQQDLLRRRDKAA